MITNMTVVVYIQSIGRPIRLRCRSGDRTIINQHPCIIIIRLVHSRETIVDNSVSCGLTGKTTNSMKMCIESRIIPIAKQGVAVVREWLVAH